MLLFSMEVGAENKIYHTIIQTDSCHVEQCGNAHNTSSKKDTKSHVEYGNYKVIIKICIKMLAEKVFCNWVWVIFLFIFL